ncbi:MAG: GWxTD domain-containing protein [Thermoanaerobaculia bacterium]
MKIRNFLTALAVTAVSVSALADLSTQYSDWGKGPAQFLMTKSEAAQWKNIKSDDEAKAFIALFWARRDPTPDTPAKNEFKENFDTMVATADKNFAEGKVAGSMTDRGQVLVLYGPPTKMARGGANTSGRDDNNDMNASTGTELTWLWEGKDAVQFNQPRSTVKFIDRFGNGQFRAERGTFDLKSQREKSIEASIKQPNLTAAPTVAVATPVAVPAAPAAPAPAAVVTELTTPALQTAINEFKAAAKNPYEGKLFVTTGEFVTGEGETFVPVQLYVPKSAAVPTTGVTFFGAVQDASGNNVVAFEEPAKVTVSKDDQFVEKSLAALPAGKYRGYFGLAQDGKPLSITAADMELTGAIDKTSTGASPLILSNNLYPLTEAQMANEPYAFGGIKVISKADKVFKTSDELWYFIELRNPGVPEAAVAEATQPVSVSGEATPAMPKIQVKIDIEGMTNEKQKVKKTAPPMEIEAIPMKGVPGHYGVGNAIPLATFKPGEYTFTIKAIDTVKKQSYTMSDKFRVIQ